MKLRSVLILILLNVAVLCAGFYFFRWLAVDELATRTVLIKEQMAREHDSFSPRPTASGREQERVVYVTNKFNWAQVESS